MFLLAKLCATLGVVLNFFGSIMLLRDFRDIFQLPYFRWQSQRIKAQLNGRLANSQNGGHSLLSKAIDRKSKGRTFSIVEILLAPPQLRQDMRLNNEHNGLRKALGLDSYLIIDRHGLIPRAVNHSFSEIEKHLIDWTNDPDPEASTDRTRALKFFIGGFALLTFSAVVDLVAYVLALS